MEWTPEYSKWRYGGWYVDNVRYPSGAVGCVSRNFADRKWRIACDGREGSFPGGPNDHTYPSRDAAARAEKVESLCQARCSRADEGYHRGDCPKMPGNIGRLEDKYSE
jgi:hypothetical protein